jgi:hypothetical protein
VEGIHEALAARLLPSRDKLVVDPEGERSHFSAADWWTSTPGAPQSHL